MRGHENRKEEITKTKIKVLKKERQKITIQQTGERRVLKVDPISTSEETGLQKAI